MVKPNWKSLINERLLLTDEITGISRSEFTLLEVSPSGKTGKFKNELCGNCVFWSDLSEYKLIEVLPPIVYAS